MSSNVKQCQHVSSLSSEPFAVAVPQSTAAFLDPESSQKPYETVCVTVTLGIMAASGFSQPSPAEKYHYHALWLLLFKIRSSLSQSSAKPHEWTLRTSKSILRLLDHWGRQSNQRSIFNMYLGIKLLYPPKNGGIIYIYPNSGTIPTSIQSNHVRCITWNTGHIWKPHGIEG